jgi:D-alanine-D-alanine ligase
MKIAFTYNLKTTNNLEDAEFDSPETVNFITRTLKELGHQVEPVEVSGPVSGIVARLEALGPELIFNTAEGRHGKLREGFYPAIFEQLNIPFTGSDAYTCGITLDKYLTKLILEKEGILTPKSLFISSKNLKYLDASRFDLNFPIFLKPNFEGSSKGIHGDNVIHDFATLMERVGQYLRLFPEGLLVEEFIPGKDVTVPF